MMRGLASAILFSSLPFLIEGVNGLDPTPVLRRRQDQTPTFDTSSPLSSPLLILHNFESFLTSCTPVNVTWGYAGPFIPLDLIATNIGVIPPASGASLTNTFTDGQMLAVPSGASQPQPTQVFIAQGVPPQASTVPWNVNLPMGWYQIFADFESTFQDQTDPFFVLPGRDVSCLGGATPTSATSSVSSASSVLSSGVSIPTSAGATVVPVPAARKDSQVGVIVGVVAGAVVFLIIVLMAYLWLRRKKNALDKPIGGQLGGAKLSRGWGGLGSMSSAHSERLGRRNPASRDLASATGNHFAESGALGAGLTETDETRGNNMSPFSSSMEKFASSPAPYANPFDDAEGGLALATLPISSSRTSLQHLGPSPHLYIPSDDDFFLYPNEPNSTRERTSSVDVHLHSSFSSSPPADIEMVRSYSTSSSTRSPSTDLSHQLQKKANRQSTGSQSNVARRMPRKPVPAYDPSLPAPSNVIPDASSPPSSYIPSPVPSPVPPPAILAAPTASFGSSTYGHYSKKLQPNSDGSGLVHKSSFGPGGVEGKPVHYLIPDMPPQTKS